MALEILQRSDEDMTYILALLKEEVEVFFVEDFFAG